MMMPDYILIKQSLLCTLDVSGDRPDAMREMLGLEALVSMCTQMLW